MLRSADLASPFFAVRRGLFYSQTTPELAAGLNGGGLFFGNSGRRLAMSLNVRFDQGTSADLAPCWLRDVRFCVPGSHAFGHVAPGSTQVNAGRSTAGGINLAAAGGDLTGCCATRLHRHRAARGNTNVRKLDAIGSKNLITWRWHRRLIASCRGGACRGRRGTRSTSGRLDLGGIGSSILVHCAGICRTQIWRGSWCSLRRR
jgi:hypothetical protein